MSHDEVHPVTVDDEQSNAAARSGGTATVSEVLSEDLARQTEATRERVGRAAAQKVVPHPTVEERLRTGRVARAEVPREQLSGWQPPADRADPVALLQGQ